MARASFVFVGSVNRRLPYFPSANGRGIAVFAFDPETGGGQPVSLTEGIENPTYLSVDSQRSCVYATSETAGPQEGMVTAYRFDPASGGLSYINARPTLGTTAAHNSLSRDGRFLLVANYGDLGLNETPDQAVAVLPIREDGSLGPACGSVAHQGRGPNAARQERPHAHCAVSSPDRQMVVVADLGIDAVLCHRLGEDGSLAPDPEPFRLPPGSGPRCVAFHPSRPLAYVINELNSTVCALSFDRGYFRLIDSVSTIPATAGEENYPADLQLSGDGRFLYGSNRGHDSIAIYAVDRTAGRLAPAGHCPAGGRTPRSFAIDPTGRWLLVANQNSDCVAVFGIDPRNGSLADSGRRLQIGTPMCVQFLSA